MAYSIRQEINLTRTIFPSSTTAVTSDGLSQLDTTQFDTPVTYYFEVVGVNTDNTLDGTVKLRRTGTTTDDASVTFTHGGSVPNFVRQRTSFTPPAGQTVYIVAVPIFSGSTGTIQMRSARIIIVITANEITKMQAQMDTGGNDIGLTNTVVAADIAGGYWKYTASHWNGTVSFFAETVYKAASTKSSVTIRLEEDNGSLAGWATKVTIVSAGTAAVQTRVRVSFTPTDGRTYRISSLCASSKSGYSLVMSKVIAQQTGNPSKFQSQYMMITSGNLTQNDNSQDQQNWDPTEWGGVSNGYMHQVDSQFGQKCKLTVGGTDITNSAVDTSVSGAVAGYSSLLNMPAAGQMDPNMNGSNTTGMAVDRLLVFVEVLGEAAFTAPTEQPYPDRRQVVPY